MAKPNVLVICPPDHYVLRNLEAIRDSANIYVGNEPGAVEDHAKSAEIILYSGLTGNSVPLADVWPYAKQVKWIHSLAAGVDKVLFPALIESPVVLTNARGVFKRSLAEFAVLGMLYFYKHVRRLVESQQAHKWDDFLVDWLPGKIMGVVGYGEIGRECAMLAKAVGVKVYATRRKVELSATDPILDRVFAPTRLKEMLSQVDVVLAAAPLTAETRHMIGEPEFNVMKPSAIVMNVGRGPVIDEAALIQALKQKRITGAALDVFEVEPLPEDHPFWDMDNVLLSPHCTDRTRDPDWLDLSMQCFIDNFRHYTNGEALENVVDKRAGY
ncbi:MAG: D-2-hydroxyacid dehydrogenase [Acidobacteriaceae bacterium]|nr:D-2-hydroxyacid dehydrogenase [Acidobacteriaceae bacterium]MBV9781868.1 D-2-hydroxyacid dehydrogenase [Acidobacteriaceae bacterium]